jgi:hypothetical protein
MTYNQPDSAVSQEAQRLLRIGRERFADIRARTIKKGDKKDAEETTIIDTTSDEINTRSGPTKRQLKKLIQRQQAKRRVVVDPYTKLNELGWVPKQYHVNKERYVYILFYLLMFAEKKKVKMQRYLDSSQSIVLHRIL